MPQPDDAKKLAGAAMRLVSSQPTTSTGVAELTLEAKIDAAIKKHDPRAIFDLVPEIARAPVTTQGILKSMIRKEMGKDISMPDLHAAIKQEYAKQKAERRGNLPEILTTGRPLREITEEALKALRKANNPPHVFVRSGVIVYIAFDEQDRPSIVDMSIDALRGTLDRTANYIKVTPNGGDTQCFPPVEICRDILALSQADWGLPPLAGVVESPTLRADGSILDKPGYDAQSSLYYHPPGGLDLPPIEGDILRDDMDEALEVIDDVFGDFPFVLDSEADQTVSASKANMLGLLLTPICRPAITGCTPLALIDAPAAGTGKSLLVDVFASIVTGRPAPMSTYPKEEPEMQKSIGSTLLAGRPLICFDNVEGVMGSPNLALALTAKEYQFRILGASRVMIAQNLATWVATGNNIRPQGDLPRRCYQIRLDAESSAPYTGRRFRHPDLLGFVRANRPRLLHALLVLARAWFAAGRPAAEIGRTVGSFESWHRTIAGILQYAGVPGFLANVRAMHEETDETVLQWEAFLLELHERFRRDETSTVPFSANDVVHAIESDATKALGESLPANSFGKIDGKAGNKSLTRALGYAFRARLDRRHGGKQVRITKYRQDGEERVRHGGVSAWQIRLSL